MLPSPSSSANRSPPLLAFSVLPRDLGFPPDGSPSTVIAESSHTPDVIWTLLLLVPLLCVVVQLALWSGCYALRGQYLQLVKARASQHLIALHGHAAAAAHGAAAAGSSF